MSKRVKSLQASWCLSKGALLEAYGECILPIGSLMKKQNYTNMAK